MAVGGVVKVALSYVLIGIPQVAAMGSAISTVASYVVMVVLNLIAIRSSLPRMDSVVRTALPLLLSAGVMGGVSYGFYWLLAQFISPRLAVIPAILLAIVVYAVCVVLFKGVSYDDVVMLPKGQALARLFRMRPEEPQRSLPVEESAQSLSAGEALQEEAPRQAPAPAQAKRARGGKYIPRHMR